MQGYEQKGDLKALYLKWRKQSQIWVHYLCSKYSKMESRSFQADLLQIFINIFKFLKSSIASYTIKKERLQIQLQIQKHAIWFWKWDSHESLQYQCFLTGFWELLPLIYVTIVHDLFWSGPRIFTSVSLKWADNLFWFQFQGCYTIIMPLGTVYPTKLYYGHIFMNKTLMKYL